VGVPLGLRIGYCLSAPLYGSQSDLAGQGIALVGLTALVVVILLGWAAARHAWGPLVAAIALVGAVMIGGRFAPSAIGSSQSANGSGSVGTSTDEGAYWSGSVVCRWQQGDATVHDVAGFDVVISDPSLVAELGLDDAALGLGPTVTVVAITLPHTATGPASIGVGESRDQYTGTGGELALDRVTPDLSRGRAVSANGLLVVTWSCAR